MLILFDGSRVIRRDRSGASELFSDMKPILTIDNLSKQYRLGSQQAAYSTLRESIVNATRTAFGRLRRNGNSLGTIWALKDVSFDVYPGEVVGIIGRNGAGKSTLLKVLSRITEPTTGKIDLYGRVGSLLEVGTGFHPELSGRENIYLNGAILGMKHREIDRQFDKIVEFAEVDKFIDTPVKRYSSGMYVRLAFAVAAHMDPEILVVDEVLAVGDDAFQKKCLGKLGQVARGGRTVLFVSHNMAAVTSLCPRSILLEQGMISKDGASSDVISHYLRYGTGMTSRREWSDLESAPGDETVRLRSVSVCDEKGQIAEAFDIRRRIGITFEYDVLRPGNILCPTFSLHMDTGVLVFWAADRDPEWENKPRPAGRFVSTAWIEGNFLNSGTMLVGVTATTLRPKRVHFHEQAALSFKVMDRMGPDTARGEFTGSFPGAVRPQLKWTTQFCREGELPV